MKDLLEDTNCTMFKVKNPETGQTEIIIRFSFASEQEAMEFSDTFKNTPEYTDFNEIDKNITYH
tara:strand:- start:3062 stop:3253 length:192 start_codon:yes stop_codon:yes gene_type:complete